MNKKTEEVKVWDTVQVVSEDDYAVFQTQRVERRHPISGAVKSFSVIHCCDWVNVVAITPAGEMIFVKQYRHGTNTVTTELPGGMVDADEDGLKAAKRELREETGYTSEAWSLLGSTYPNPAIQSNQCSTWLALNAEQTHPVAWDPNELMETLSLTPAEVDAGVQRGEINHSLVLVALFWYQQSRGSHR
jgi:8-oxo-dGTP pyrophosphatase MutT (NUDIX family)